MKTEEQKEKAREAWRRWSEKKGWVGKERAREAAKRSYARKLAKAGKEVRSVRGRPMIEPVTNFCKAGGQVGGIKEAEQREVALGPEEEKVWDDRINVPIEEAEGDPQVMARNAGAVKYWAKRKEWGMEVKKEEPGAREVDKTEVEKKVEADLERLLAKREGEWAI